MLYVDIFDRIEHAINKMGSDIPDLLERTDFEQKLLSLLKDKKIKELIPLIEDFNKKHPQNEFASDLLPRLRLATKEALASAKSIDYSVGDAIVDRVCGNFELNSKDNKKIICIDENIPFDVCKSVAIDVVNNFGVSKRVFPFVVSKNKIISGRIVQSNSGKVNQILMSQVIKGHHQTEIRTRFIGESHPLSAEKFELPTYTYTFVSNNQYAKDGYQTYNVISKDPLPMDELMIAGMEIPIRDTLKMGNTANLEVNTTAIFVIEYTKLIKSISDEEFNNLIPAYKSHDTLYKQYFSILRQPELFEKFLLSMMFCSKGTEGFPSHLGFFGPAGCGKSKILEAITGTFGEIRLLETTTIKSIVPNFGGYTPDPGLFIKSKRFCVVDEFLNLVVKADKVEEMRLFNSLLTHADGISASGKHANSINAKPTATMVFASNYIKGRIPDFVSLCGKLDVPFLSRFILYSYNDHHVEFINNKEEELSDIIAQESRKQNKQISVSEFVNTYNAEAIQITDYLKNKPVIFSNKEVSNIFNEVKTLIPADSNIIELYNGRSRKHISAIIDGVTKYNYIINNRQGEFVTLPEDYELAKDIWYMIVGSWTAEYTRMPHKYRERVLTESELAVFLAIKEHPGQRVSEIEYLVKFRPHSYITKLLDMGVIREESLGSINSYYAWDYIKTENQSI
jgi:hypothetical protein